MMMIFALYETNSLVGMLSVRSLKQQFAPLWHIILIPRKPVHYLVLWA